MKDGIFKFVIIGEGGGGLFMKLTWGINNGYAVDKSCVYILQGVGPFYNLVTWQRIIGGFDIGESLNRYTDTDNEAKGKF